MKITLCNSVSFIEEAKKIRKELTNKGHNVFVAPYMDSDSKELERILSDREKYLNDFKPVFIKEHFNNILKSDAILVINLEKNGIKNYVGGSTFAEIIFAFYNNKKIFLLNPIPEEIKIFKDELKTVKPIIINGDLDLIR
jgi:diphthamide synthase subunit DPH2